MLANERAGSFLYEFSNMFSARDTRLFLNYGLILIWNSKICEVKKQKSNEKRLPNSGHLNAECIIGSLGDVSHAAESSGLQTTCCELANDGERLAAVGSLAEGLMYALRITDRWMCKRKHVTRWSALPQSIKLRCVSEGASLRIISGHAD